MTSPAWRCVRVVLAVTGAIVLALLVAFISLGHWLEAPAGVPVKADVIVLLGGDSRPRLITGLELWPQGLAPRVFLAGSDGDRLPIGRALPNARLEYLIAEGVPREAIVVGDLAFNSWEEAANTLSLMRHWGWRRALVVSDPPHMRRLSWIWRRTFDGADASFVLIPSRPRWWNAAEWWRDEWSGQFVLMELNKMGYYFAFR